MGSGERRGRKAPPRDEAEHDLGRAPRESADADVDPREEEGFDQPQSRAQRPPHRQDDQDDVQ
jgi:hypothetical protein